MPDQARLFAQLENAAATITPYWPLQSFIAANPIQGLERLSFEEAVELGTDLFGGRGYPNAVSVRRALSDGRIDRDVLQEVAERHDRPDLVKDGPADALATASTKPAATQVNRLLIKWLAAFLEEGQAGWPMPGREHGFWRAWRNLAVHDRDLPERAEIGRLPEEPLAALAELMSGVPEAEREAVLTKHLVALPGWSGYVKWRAGQRAHPWQQAAPIALVDYLAVRLTLSRLFGEREPVPASNGTLAPDGAVWLEAWEESYRRPLLERLQRSADTKDRRESPPAAQLIFCIDVRSEVFRRHLEAVGPYDTLGFAGFFGLPIAHQTFGSATAVASCPVLLEPKHLVQDTPAGGHERQAERHLQGRAHLTGVKTLTAQLKESVATPFAFVETAGGLFGLAMAGRTLMPKRFSDLLDRLRRRVSPDAKLAPQIALTACGPREEDVSGFSDAERIFYAEASLSIMGLTRDFAPLVLLCGHGGETINNPFAAGLDCGACGGNHGGPNARVMAAILNDPVVRRGLVERGIEVPETTLFLAAQHNTTTDIVTLFDPEVGRAAHPEIFATLLKDLGRARSAASAERCRHLPGATGDSLSAVSARATDWAQVRPEWGLARNAAFIVGHRDLTHGLDLEGRSFLHSYDWQSDAEGQALEVILTAPMVVAEWINTQYYFSTVDNVAYGAGSKITHNVVGTFGVMQGNASDLMTGLPAQSVMAADDRGYHEPLRLMTVVEAPLARVEQVVRRNDILKTLFGNGWVALAVLDPETGLLSRRGRNGTWAAAFQTSSERQGAPASQTAAAPTPQVA
ncbi:DUF2309 domain-containing protein [Algihabitans albus]|uniref:DUF2309 domain-containing protein n=1 Tax=Algihabitans albus TaxID=2164067 RepID=UPI000E5C8013|nr:DUF2309 domain-containing protein [Algihabitans albus]